MAFPRMEKHTYLISPWNKQNLVKVGISGLKFIEFIETKVNRLGKVIFKSILVLVRKKQILVLTNMYILQHF